MSLSLYLVPVSQLARMQLALMQVETAIERGVDLIGVHPSSSSSSSSSSSGPALDVQLRRLAVACQGDPLVEAAVQSVRIRIAD
jgi:hypothetical protein